MKKSTGKIVIVALILITVGIGLFIGGIFAVGGMAAAKEGLAEHGVFIDRGFHIDINRSRPRAASKAIRISDEEKSMFQLEEVDSLEIEVGAAQVELLQNDSSDQITVWADCENDTYVKNGVLHIENQVDLEECTIIIAIPSNAVFGEIDISGSACEMNIERLETKYIELEVDAGQITVADLNAEDAQFEIGAGEIFVDYANIEQMDVNIGMGNFVYEGEITRRGSVDCGMGNAELHLKGDKEDYNYEIDCAAGNVDIGNQSYGGLAAEKTINNHADATIEIDCGMGNVTIEF